MGTQGVCDEEMGRESVLLLDYSFSGFVRSFVACYVGMCSYFAQGGSVACQVSGLDEGGDGIEE